MTDRRSNGWLWVFAAAAVAVAAGAEIVWCLYLGGGAKLAAAFVPLPAIWLAMAVFANRNLSRHSQAWMGAAVGYTAVVNGLIAVSASRRYHGVRLWWADPGDWEPYLLAQFPLSVTVLLATAVGWWQRRQDRLADPDTDA